MTRSRYGMIAGIAGAALAGWYWRRRRWGSDYVARGMSHAGHERSETIYSNTPTTR